MNSFEKELQSALSRREPPAGFADRVMARIPEAPVQGRRWFRQSWMAAAAALLITALGGGSWEYSKARAQRTQAERAKAELIQALEVTSVKLQETRARIIRSTGGLI